MEKAGGISSPVTTHQRQRQYQRCGKPHQSPFPSSDASVGAATDARRHHQRRSPPPSCPPLAPPGPPSECVPPSSVRCSKLLLFGSSPNCSSTATPTPAATTNPGQRATISSSHGSSMDPRPADASAPAAPPVASQLALDLRKHKLVDARLHWTS
jgi:hypothetical protein